METFNTQIEKNQVYTGQIFPNYKHLCQYIGIPYATGKQRIIYNRHLECYFRWKKLEGSNQIQILETNYDEPKKFEDKRGGSKPKSTANIIMQCFAQYEWSDGFYSKTQILRRMGLVPRQPFKGKFRIECRTLNHMLYDGLTSALGTIGKKYSGKISKEVVGWDQRMEAIILNMEEKRIFERIRAEVLQQLDMKSEWDVVEHNKWSAYRNKMNEATMEEMEMTEVHEYYWIRDWEKINYPITIDNRTVIRAAIEQLTTNYVKNHGGIGVVAPERYRAFLEEEARNILNDATFTTTINESQKVVTNESA